MARRVPIAEDEPVDPEAAFAELTHALGVARFRYGLTPAAFLPRGMLGADPAWRLVVWDGATSAREPTVALELGPYSEWAQTCPRALGEIRRRGMVR